MTVIAQKVVGPYETVQLSSSDPAALTDWLASHNYVVPADIDPIIKAYVGEGSGFLALKLVPGLGIQSMRPVRVTSPGASPTLPLRMVAAGVGATTPITLWILGEGAHIPANFPWFTIPENKTLLAQAISAAISAGRLNTSADVSGDPLAAHGVNGSRRPRRTASASACALRSSPS